MVDPSGSVIFWTCATAGAATLRTGREAEQLGKLTVTGPKLGCGLKGPTPGSEIVYAIPGLSPVMVPSTGPVVPAGIVMSVVPPEESVPVAVMGNVLAPFTAMDVVFWISIETTALPVTVLLELACDAA
jgi:hypothetical protein